MDKCAQYSTVQYITARTMHVKPVKASLSKRQIWDLRDQPTPDGVQYVQSGSTLAVAGGWLAPPQFKIMPVMDRPPGALAW